MKHEFFFFGQYKEMGYLPQAMVNYLALLGWGDGTEDEFFTIDDLGLYSIIYSVIFSGKFFKNHIDHLFMCSHFGAISHLQLKNSL